MRATGASLLPLTTTKIGPGDKERAYVVRQNLVLKTLLGTAVLILSLAGLLCSTTYEIQIQKRHSLVHALEHREEEHASHMRVLRLSTLLQTHLKVSSAPHAQRRTPFGSGLSPSDR